VDFLVAGLTGLALAMDCFAVAVCLGSLNHLRLRDWFLIPLHFGLFQGGMLLAGFYLGARFERVIASIDHWVAFALLGAIGANLIYESFKKPKCERVATEKELFFLSIATSVDALIVGIALSLGDGSGIATGIIVGAITLFMTLLGLAIGKRLKQRVARISYAGIAGGLVLIGLGAKILIEHLFLG